ncbi:antibiotic biosynthesis monooxygenase (ABM) superfamily enzyme [Labrenzia sp. EL_208]|uniref:Antibiotic biosynthesis monooxygenase n=1 Tax=Roseibium album TaxID=311410 RepID=A0A0M6ZTV7_9HYPH|nr:hypothetical protein [Roseibium album]MBG6173875.1 antibiotic biosynthesis monooxygenase (ABM) superfamily enzyme [Labrenzia sp. EL_132]MBG6228669.1 antibiotic biosynthesis monooxygenase (ABM) superfamily enzyme [Labrenzia sp. EL_208]CTQ60829.1 hypothetical protein LA5094_03607 [Roseibium album]CTQ64873.1 hypothetical protein LA5095_00361 [Roseibium album]CTQ73043.1 hypothetical protein LA5096_03501 [Roseibium album]
MIKRIWHGWTTHENADRYFGILTDTVIPGIEAKTIPGYLGIEVLRRDLTDEVEFKTIMSFRSIDDVIAFQGPNYARSHVPGAAQEVLKRWDQTAEHYEFLLSRNAAGAMT